MDESLMRVLERRASFRPMKIRGSKKRPLRRGDFSFAWSSQQVKLAGMA
jgi:hypothetical protein